MQDDFRPRGSVKSGPKLKPISRTTNSLEPETPFETPEQASEHGQPTGPIVADHSYATQQLRRQPRGSGHHWFNLPWPPNKEEIALIAVVVAMAGFGIFGFIKLHKTNADQPVIAHKTIKAAAAVVQPTTVASTLSGLSVSPDINKRPVVGVMIENSLDARPQAGLSQAGVVFEAVAEGGVTRFLALYQDQQPTNIGPIRSARPYYVQWDQGFDAAYAHVGGSPDALNDIKAWNIKDLNQFYNSGPYHRISSRPSPHNMYSNVVDLAALASSKGYSSSYSGFQRKAAATAKTPTASSIDFNLSSNIYNPHYAYDATTNTYTRSEGGSSQTDANTGKQLVPNVVIAMVVPLSQGALDASGAYYSNYNPIGSGATYVFQDGTVTTGTWSKSSNTAQITFSDATGKAIALNAGQTWISAVSAASKVSYR